MKKIITYIVTALALCAVIGWFTSEYKQVKNDRDRYRSNMQVLADSVRHYKTAAGDNAVRAGVLQMELDEYKKMRSGDMATIKQLGIKQKELERVTTAQSQTIINLKGNVHDSIIYRDRNITDTLRCMEIVNPWYSLSGCTDKDGTFAGRFECRDSLIIVENVKYKRFLGFLWRTKRIKERRINVANKNPYTRIDNVEHIIIQE